jgi:hypothetical protein
MMASFRMALRLKSWTGGLVLALLAASLYFRTAGLTENGIRGSDTFQYWEIAWMWLEGRPVLNNDPHDSLQYYRPVFYALNALSLKLFGPHDWAIRAVVALFETVNGALIALILALIFSNWALIVGGVALYVTSPLAFQVSQTELPHTQSSTFVLAGLFFLLTWIHRPSRGRLLLSGACVGLAALVHGSVIFFAPAYVLVILLHRLPLAPKKKELLLVAREIAFFSAAFFLVYFAPGLVVGWRELFAAVRSEAGIRTDDKPSVLALMGSYTTEGPREALSLPVAALFWLGSLLLAAKLLGLRGKSWSSRRESLAWVPFVILAFFTLNFSLVFKNVFHLRLFLPLVPLVIVVALYALERAALRIPRVRPAAAIAVAALALCVSNVWAKPRTLQAYYKGEMKGAARATYDVLAAKVGPQARLLALPALNFSYRFPFSARVYFGENVSYFFTCREAELDEWTRREKIRYVVLSGPDGLNRGLQPAWEKRVTSGEVCRIGQSLPSVERELELIRNWLRRRNAVLLSSSPHYGEIYDLAPTKKGG